MKGVCWTGDEMVSFVKVLGARPQKLGTGLGLGLEKQRPAVLVRNFAICAECTSALDV